MKVGRPPARKECAFTSMTVLTANSNGASKRWTGCVAGGWLHEGGGRPRSSIDDHDNDRPRNNHSSAQLGEESMPVSQLVIGH